MQSSNAIHDDILLLDRLTATLRWLRDTSYRLDQDLSGAIDLAASSATAFCHVGSFRGWSACDAFV